jgi:glucose-1-phosphate cytidylyltransferase
MKVIILAGGLGTRFAEETETKPKPMIEICGKPILWHLMNCYALQGYNEFLIAVGYKGEVISNWVNSSECEWNAVALDTGLNTQTGGRLRQSMNYLNESRVLATYGDGLANISIAQLLERHTTSKKIATITAVRPPARFGYLQLEGEEVTHFGEKNQADAGWINGGFFVLEKEVSNYISSDSEAFETGALPRLVGDKMLAAYRHQGFWKPIDTLREKLDLERMFNSSVTPPWLTQEL